MGGLSTFRSTVQLEQAKNDFLSALREAQNLARNSVSSSIKGSDILTGQVDGYALVFNPNLSDYSLRYCIKTSFVGIGQYDCSGVEKTSDKLLSSPEVTIAPSDSNKCHGILFARLTAEISALSSDIDTPDDTGTCEIVISQSQSNDTRTIVVDLANNNISQQ